MMDDGRRQVSECPSAPNIAPNRPERAVVDALAPSCSRMVGRRGKGEQSKEGYGEGTGHAQQVFARYFSSRLQYVF